MDESQAWGFRGHRRQRQPARYPRDITWFGYRNSPQIGGRGDGPTTELETAETEAIQARWMRGGRGSGSGATMGGEAEAETDWPVTRW
jgi:hypothetical protein